METELFDVTQDEESILDFSILYELLQILVFKDELVDPFLNLR